ncbi:cyclic nucleotide-binding domain-containing protein [Tundrisphaera lichenicola]|uniref:cyclic nucleotide-binding domain-containing protein n=1 Tax=Tundrisphaera lichenicola TaxID=2029860 RepID=UPI003EB8CB9E
MPTISTDGSSRFLATPLLTRAEEDSRLTIFRALVEAKVPAGTPLLTQGDPNKFLWFVEGGSITIERTQPDGRVDELAVLSGPAMYGTTTFFRSMAPSATIRAKDDLVVWMLDHRSHDRLRQDHPRAAEALALEVVRVLSERFDQLDRRLAEMMAQHLDDHPRANEWANFRARLFEEPSI